MATTTVNKPAAASAATSGKQDDPLEAALAAAAELAKNGGAFLLNPLAMPGLTAPAASPATTGASGATQPMLPPSIAAMISAATAAATAGNEPELSTDSLGEANDDFKEEHDDDGSTNHYLGEVDAERRIARSRERNREHARRTRLRKKAHLDALQSKVKSLQAESKVLKQSLEECSIASILVGLSNGDEQESKIQALVSEASQIQNHEVLKVVAGKRKRFLSDASSCSDGDHRTSSQPMEIEINGHLTKIGGGKTHINWKSGLYKDEIGVERQLTHEQLESLRRERNRMHAKMTRNRKKNFISSIQKTIEKLESNNRRMKEVLASVVHTHFKADTPSAVPVGVTPTASPALLPKSTSFNVPPLPPSLPVAPKTAGQPAAAPVVEEPSSTRISRAHKPVAHGFSTPVY